MSKRHQLNEAVERGLFLLPEVPGESTLLSIPGVQGRKTAVSHQLANIVGAATLNEHTADAAIQEVIKIFARQGKTFNWRVGPYSTPKDLGQRLLTAGLKQENNLSGLFIADWHGPYQTESEITIRQGSPVDIHLIRALIKETYPVPPQWCSTLSKAFLPPSDYAGPKVSTFMAFVEGQKKPVGMASMFWFPDRPLVFFGGAAVQPAYRRQGIYSSLVTHRLAIAEQNGISAAVIQAIAASADACKKAGFTKFCELDGYTWHKEVRNNERH
jgi:N-acetylglutamate synthase-like GNAT family acetyltransferase